jgi:hypothetical protein
MKRLTPGVEDGIMQYEIENGFQNKISCLERL